MTQHVKRFAEWLGLKKKLHETLSQPPMVKEGDIWWMSLGENVGQEIDGKSELFSRPAIVYKKLDTGLGVLNNEHLESVKRGFLNLYK